MLETIKPSFDQIGASLEKTPIRSQARPYCFLCQTLGVEAFDSLTDRLFGVLGKWRLVRCPNVKCGLIWLDPSPAMEDLGKLYANYFTHSNQMFRASSSRFAAFSGAVLGRLGFPTESRVFWRVVATLFGSFPPVREYVEGTVLWLKPQWRGAILDVGCGNGEFLAKMRSLQWQVAGVEPDAGGSRVAREHFALDVWENLAQIPDHVFDVVTMSHVLEHLPDPLKSLTECRRVLRPGGRLIVATPNIASLGFQRFGSAWVHLDPPRHLQIFTSQSLRNCVESAGFSVETVSTPTRSAFFAARSSALIQKYGVVSTSREATSIYAYYRALLFHFWEYFLGPEGSGEELLMVAARQ